MKSIQSKFILLVLSCVLLCSIALGGSAIFNINQVVDSDSARFMNLQCMEGAARFNSLLSRIEQSVKTLSVFTLEQLESVEQLKNDDQYVEAFTRQLESVAVNAADNTEGALAVYVRFNPEFTAPDSGLFWSKTDSSGYFQKLSPTKITDYNKTDVEHVGWYYIPIQTGKPLWMSPYYNQNINVRMISYVIPLYKENEIIGVVGMDIDFSVFEKLAGDITPYETGYAFLCDEEGTIVYHPDYALNTELEKVEASMEPVVKELQNETSSDGLFSYTRSNRKYEMSYRTIDNGMRLVITAPLHEIDAVKNRLIIQLLLSLFVIAILFVLITISVTKKIVRPLRELNLATQKIAGGDLSISLTKHSKDEVGMLAESFQQTVDQLQKYINYINGLAYRDALTGVKNKMAYQEAEKRLEEQMRLGLPQFAVVVLDINNLKETNDKYGHDFGDMLIIDACKLICKTFRRSPVYRIGGDEFVVILENADCDNYVQLMEDFAQGMEEQRANAQLGAQFSLARGIAVYNPESDLVFANVFKRADEAMYQNKADMKANKKQEDHK